MYAFESYFIFIKPCEVKWWHKGVKDQGTWLNWDFEPRPLCSEATLPTLNGLLPPLLSLPEDKAAYLNPDTLLGPYRMGSVADSHLLSLLRSLLCRDAQIPHLERGAQLAEVSDFQC